MRTLFLLALTHLWCATSALAGETATSTDASIWNVAAQKLCESQKSGWSVLTNRTEAASGTRSVPPLDSDAFTNLLARGKTPVLIPPIVGCRTLRLADGKVVDNALNEPAGAAEDGFVPFASFGKAFERQFPGATYVVTFSRPGYGEDGNVAVLYVSVTCGPLCGSGSYWQLRKSGDSWHIEKQVNAWIA
jgi:hypothetical protein